MQRYGRPIARFRVEGTRYNIGQPLVVFRLYLFRDRDADRWRLVPPYIDPEGKFRIEFRVRSNSEDPPEPGARTLMNSLVERHAWLHQRIRLMQNRPFRRRRVTE